jgi:hypothetical protein
MAYLGEPPDFGFDEETDLAPYDSGLASFRPEDAAEEEEWLAKAQRALDAFSQLSMRMPQAEEPEPIRLQRMQEAEEPKGFLPPQEGMSRGRVGLEKGIDVANLISQVFARRDARKRGRQGPQLQAPIYSRRMAEDEYRSRRSTEADRYNTDVSNKETLANSAVRNRRYDRETARLNALLPSVMGAAFREPKTPQPGATSEKLSALYGTDAYKNATPEEQRAMETRVLGAEAPQPRESTYDREMARFRAREEAGRMFPSVIKGRAAASGANLDESDVKFGSDQMAKYVFDYGMDEREAAEAAWRMVEERRQLRTRVAGGRPYDPGNLNAGTMGALGMAERPFGDTMGAMGMRQGQSGDPALQQKLRIYKKQIELDPSRRELLRRAIIDEHGIDPESILPEEMDPTRRNWTMMGR